MCVDFTLVFIESTYVCLYVSKWFASLGFTGNVVFLSYYINVKCLNVSRQHLISSVISVKSFLSSLTGF